MWFWLADSWLISGHLSSPACRRSFLWAFIKSWISPCTAVRHIWSGGVSRRRDLLLASRGWCLSLWGPMGMKNIVLLRRNMKRAHFLWVNSQLGEESVKSFSVSRFNWSRLLNPDCVSQCVSRLWSGLFMCIRFNTCDRKRKIRSSVFKKNQMSDVDAEMTCCVIIGRFLNKMDESRVIAIRAVALLTRFNPSRKSSMCLREAEKGTFCSSFGKQLTAWEEVAVVRAARVSPSRFCSSNTVVP